MKNCHLLLNDHIQDFSEEEILRLMDKLPDWRRDAALRFKHFQGRAECTLSYLELLRGLRLFFGISDKPRFEYNEHGKPFLPDFPEIHFSLSHCREAVGCLLSNRPCGLDIERIRPAKETLVRHIMSEQETKEILTSKSPNLAFTRLWTQKEAVFKLRGTGITDDIKEILSPQNLHGICLQTTENPLRGWVLTTTTVSTGENFQK